MNSNFVGRLSLVLLLAREFELGWTCYRHSYKRWVGLVGLFSRRHGGVYVNPFFAALVVLGVIALVGALIVLFDKGIKRRS